jgi:hypothetical protein
VESAQELPQEKKVSRFQVVALTAPPAALSLACGSAERQPLIEFNAHIISVDRIIWHAQ